MVGKRSIKKKLSVAEKLRWQEKKVERLRIQLRDFINSNDNLYSMTEYLDSSEFNETGAFQVSASFDGCGIINITVPPEDRDHWRQLILNMICTDRENMVAVATALEPILAPIKVDDDEDDDDY